jgi:hypothetical protein
MPEIKESRVCPKCNRNQLKDKFLVDEYLRCIFCFKYSLKRLWKWYQN